jgi:hypothetical protein
MEKHTINVSGAGDLARPRSRREFLKGVAVASVGAAAGSAVLAGSAGAQSYGPSGGAQTASGSTDVDILNFALTLELLEEEFYAIALDSGVLSGDALTVIQAIFDSESAHVGVLTAGIQGAGATPVAEPQFTFPPGTFDSQASILNTAIMFEPVGVGAYIGAAPMISDPTILEVAGSIAGVEGEHVVAIQNLLGVVPPANEAFPPALSQDEVLAAVAPFIGMGSMMDTGGTKPAASTGKAY